MGRLPRITGLVVIAALLAAGCTSSPWTANRPAVASATDAVGGVASPEAGGGVAAGGDKDQALMEVMGELAELGDLDPAAGAQLMEDLSQTDPAWWPMVVQQFRAAAAYRGQVESTEGNSPRGVKGSTDDGSVRLASGVFSPGETAEVERSSGAYRMVPLPRRSGINSTVPLGQPARLPTAENVALAPSNVPGTEYPATEYPPPVYLADRMPEASLAVGPGDWQGQLAGVIETLRLRLPAEPVTDEEVGDHARLRVMQMLAGHREAAMQPIPSIPPGEQEFWSKQLYGLATWLDMEKTPDKVQRVAETKEILEEAVVCLGESAPLVVRNLAFCTEVQSYGCRKPFETYEFVPGQEVLLYAEVENLAGEPTAKGFHTSLRSSYQIFDSRGQRVVEREFNSTEEYCQNLRRDFFIGYHLYLPERIYAGEHTLQLTIEDLKSHKVGQSSIELTIVDDAQ